MKFQEAFREVVGEESWLSIARRSGVSKSALSRYYYGLREPGYRHLLTLCKVYPELVDKIFKENQNGQDE